MNRDNITIPDGLIEAMRACKEQGSTIPRSDSMIRYIWLHVTRDGIAGTAVSLEGTTTLLLNDWLNLVDESAALGAKWMMVYLDTHVDRASDIWKICGWAQEMHGIHVGLHVKGEFLPESDFASLSRLKRDKTFIVADQNMLESLAYLGDEGYTLCSANIGDEDRNLPCTHTDSIVCAGADGIMFCCGLVIGEESYRLGNVRSDSVDRAMQNHAGLEPILVSRDNVYGGCDGCPPIMVQRFSEQQARKS